jgi:signal peptidase I
MAPSESAKAPSKADSSSKESPKPKQKPKQKESARDTIESILFAFVLAFLFRTFEAEAFVIPTGSMAPTLYGRHKESNCTQCGFQIVVGASDEVNPDTGHLHPHTRLHSALCPNCGFENEQLFEELAFNGDRILVNKYPYEFGEPDRFDVFVFKWPKEPQTNYIKRLVGLPGETIRIRRGDLYKVEGQDEQILRMRPEKQRWLQIPVYDHDHAPTALIEAGWPERWAPVKRGEIGRVAGWSETPEGWTPDPRTRSFSIGSDLRDDLHWLRYRHFFPTISDWDDARAGRALNPQARLIGDFCSYNTYTGQGAQFDAQNAANIDIGRYWVGDLTINFNLAIEDLADDAELLLELCEGVSWYRCRIDPATGQARLEEVNSQLNERVRLLAEGQVPMRGIGRYSISFANVDDRLCLWVNNRLVDFGEGALVDGAGAVKNPFPTETDLTPVGIAARGVSATVSKLLLERDIYYRADFSDLRRPQTDQFGRNLARQMHDPEVWTETYLRHADQLDVMTMEVGPDHYLALGDNSPRSNDSRLWPPGLEAVPRKYLVGKAFWIYWPHGVPFLNNGRGFPVKYHYEHSPQGLKRVEDYPRYTLPFYPQVWRMTRIR